MHHRQAIPVLDEAAVFNVRPKVLWQLEVYTVVRRLDPSIRQRMKVHPGRIIILSCN